MLLLIVALLGFASAAKLGHRDDHSLDHAGSFPEPRPAVVTRTMPVNGIVTFANHACIFRNGEVRIRGTPLAVGQSGDFDIEAGFATLDNGERVNIDGGLVNVRVLPSTSTQQISESLARAGITLDEFIQQTGTIPPQQGVGDITAGVVSINGVLKNVIAGVFVVLSAEDFDSPITEVTQPEFVNDFVETVTVTQTAAHETRTVFEPVTLTKTQTVDEFTTVTSPVYNSIAATLTNIEKQAVTVPEEQVIRSPVAGSVVVNTIPVSSQTVMTVTVRTTNMFVQTLTDEVTQSQSHFVTNYSISTATVNNPVTSTVVQTITQTGVSTVYSTSTVGSTVYRTITTTVHIGTRPSTRPAIPGGY